MTLSNPRMYAAENRFEPADGITRVDLAELLRLRARAAKPRATAARIRAPLAGAHLSSLRGRGMDYAESRVYQAGDDVRNIDWRRTARSGEWHTKLFQEERERSLLLLVDTHPEMRFGTRVRYKSVAAARAAAVAGSVHWPSATCATRSIRMAACAARWRCWARWRAGTRARPRPQPPNGCARRCRPPWNARGGWRCRAAACCCCRTAGAPTRRRSVRCCA